MRGLLRRSIIFCLRAKRTLRLGSEAEKNIEKRKIKRKSIQRYSLKKSALEPGPCCVTHGTHSLERGFLRLCMSFRRNKGLQVLLCTFSFNLERTLRFESETATRQMHVMVRSHWQFSQASHFLGSEAIYLDILHWLFFQMIFIFILCLFTKIARLNGYSTHLFANDFCSHLRKSLKKANLNSTIENTSTNRSKKKIARFSLEKIANVNKP